MAKTQQQIDEDKADREQRGEADNYWWLVVRNPAREIHLFELGYPQSEDVLDENGKATGESRDVPLTRERRTVVMSELGAPDGAGAPESGWDLSLAPGRPDRYVEPKEYDEQGELKPIRARAGVTLHLLPDTEPGAPSEDGAETNSGE